MKGGHEGNERKYRNINSKRNSKMEGNYNNKVSSGG
jgi:hypothetical protein